MKVQRHINQTGRRRIRRDQVDIRLNKAVGGAAPTMSAKLNLAEMSLPGTASIYIEAYHKTSTQRFDFGTVENPGVAGLLRLDEVDLGGRLLFRVKVVDSSERIGRLLASCERIAPLDPGEQPGRDYLIKVQTCEMGEVPWKLDLNVDPGVRPVLLLNYRIPDAINATRTNPVFQALVLPAVIREVYSFIFRECEAMERESDDEDASEGGGWQHLWLNFGRQITGSDPPESDDGSEASGWTDDVVAQFCRQFELKTRLASAMGAADQ